MSYVTDRMECFRIDWTEPCPLDSANEFVPSYIAGVYAICRTDTKSHAEIWYIGQTRDFSQRMKQHRQQWSHILTPIQMNKLAVSFGTIHPIEGNPSDSTEEIRSDIESFLRNALTPKGNSAQTCKGYTGRAILVINTGKLSIIDKIMSINHDLLELLAKKQPARKPKTSNKSAIHGTLFGLLP
jgi:hypothetical protein